jgi:2-methylcitrate dehydratase PrpD
MLTMTVAGEWSRYGADLSFDDLPEQVIDHAKKLVLDILANAIGGHEWMESGPIVADATRALNRNLEGATVLATGEQMAPEWAGLVNGTLAHSLDFDNHHAKGVIHAGSSQVTAALAAGEECDASGSDVLTALVVGYEIACRLAMACNPFSSHELGFHPTGTCGLFGATAIVSKLRGLDAVTVENALGINGSQASGSMQYELNGAWNKRAHPGFAVHSAFVAAALAETGFKGAAEVIEGKDGFLQGYAARPMAERAAEGLGKQWETLNVAIKPYPLCRYTHMTLDLLIDLAKEMDLDSTKVVSIDVEIPKYGVQLVGSPIEAKRKPTSAMGAQFSAPFAAALALTQRSAGIAIFRNAVEDQSEEFRRLMQVTTVDRADDLDAIHPEFWPGRVTLEVEGEKLTRYGKHIKGERENPMTWEELGDKFVQLTPNLGDDTRGKVMDAVRSLENRSVGEVTEPIRKALRPS